ncbi:hypothetical protein NFI96_001251 [Prochilodus magdalenae]|nr:hypothetical protein NFI96_001251 [Prochilodus magdalenae]
MSSCLPWRGRTASSRMRHHGPYNLEVNSDQGLRIGEVFTVNQGELIFFDCLADSNPPNTCVWISRTENNTEVLMTGPRFEVPPHKLAQPTKFLCRAFNNVTKKQDETHFTLVVANLGKGSEKLQGESAVSPLAAITISSLLIILCMLFVFLRKTCHPKRVLMKIYSRPLPEQKGLHRSGHEDATEDFGIYEFVSLPGKMESNHASCRSLARLDSVKDLHTTIYDVIRHVPETPTLSLLNETVASAVWTSEATEGSALDSSWAHSSLESRHDHHRAGHTWVVDHSQHCSDTDVVVVC